MDQVLSRRIHSAKIKLCQRNIDGKFESWFEDGKIEYSGQYKNDARDGEWLIYNTDGTVKYKIEYTDGITKDRQMDIDESKYLDSLEKNKDKIQDPEKTGSFKVNKIINGFETDYE